MNVARNAVIGAGALVALLGLVAPARALTTVSVDPCLAAQIKAVGNGTAATLGCYAKAASKGVAVDAECLAKAAAKIGPVLDKLESKKVCPREGTSGARTLESASFGTDVATTVGGAPKKCDAAKTKNVGLYVKAVAGCYAKAAGKKGTVDVECLTKAASKLATGVAKAETKGDCSHLGQAGILETDGGNFAAGAVCALDPGCVPCGNGLNDPGEPCDASAPTSGWAQCGPELACANCNCACPSTVVLLGNTSAPASTLDAGFSGIGHQEPLVSDGTLTLQLTNCAGTSRPCGTCDLSGPIANPKAGAGQLDSRRCSTDSSKKCTSDGVCAARTCLGGANHGAPCVADSQCPSGSCPAAGTCGFYAGSNLPLSSGGVAVCTVSDFMGGVSGTLNVESGEMRTAALVRARVYSPIFIDRPCPRCTDAGGINDGASDGTCDGGPRTGLPCDANGAVPGRPDFGRTSLDCPPLQAGLLATLTIDLQSATDPVAKTLTLASPNCSGSAGDKCLCSTCNNGSAEACDENADCPDPAGPIGAICGGRRCLAGPNLGTPCDVNSECPGAPQACGRPGQPTQPSGCAEDDLPPFAGCTDADGDGEGECALGPNDTVCTIASGHAQRGCLNDMDCGGTSGSCTEVRRPCFPTGGGSFQPAPSFVGTDTVVANGLEDPPIGDVSHPTLGAVFCVAPTGSNPINYVFGLPGPARVTVATDLVAHP